MRRYLGLIVYAVICLTLAAFMGFMVGAWSVRHINLSGGIRFPVRLADSIEAIAAFPGVVRDARDSLLITFGFAPTPLLIAEQVWNDGPRVHQFPQAADPGFLLLSGLNVDTNRAGVRLIRIADGSEIVRWPIDWNYIHAHTQDNKWIPRGSPLNLRATHPVLLPDGSLVFNAGGALVRQSICEASPRWLLNGVFHHSNELAADGTLWTPSVSPHRMEGYEHPWLRTKLRDDALANISIDGKLLKRLSFAQILRDNGLEHLIFGFGGLSFATDPIHLNQITPALFDGVAWKKGDLLISARHLSTVFLYRPSTNKIIWHQTGPWKNQHSALFVNEEQISVFDNNVMAGSPSLTNPPFLNDAQVNRVIVMNLKMNEVSEPFAQALSQTRPRTVTEGRGQLISGNRLFIEETNYGRHMVLNPQGLEWSRLNFVGENNDLGALGWSRYIEADEGNRLLEVLKQPCK